MKQVFVDILNLLFPLRDDARTVTTLADDALTQLVHEKRVGTVQTLLRFADPSVRACIHEVKFHQNKRACTLLGAVLHTYIMNRAKEHIVIPVPLSTARRRKRGYNQVERIARAATLNVRTDILMRTRDTAPQTSLSRSERTRNVADAFAVRDSEAAQKILNGMHVILLDDVVTTGATMRAAKAALSPLSPASITCVALAH